MSASRYLATSVSVLAVAGAVVVVVGMGNGVGEQRANTSAAASAVPSPTWRPDYIPDPAASSRSQAKTPSSSPAKPTRSRAAPSTSPSTLPPSPRTSAATSTRVNTPAPRPAPAKHTTHERAKSPARTSEPPKPRGQALPLDLETGSATRVITVSAPSTGSTTARLQAWRKAAGGGWLRHGSSVTAHVGSAGLTWQPSESKSATPIGSFTLTQAFGYGADPGTALPYLRTGPKDYWISDTGSPYYNTHRRCGPCAHSPNESLYYTRPYYKYAVVIDYNTRNAPGGVHVGAGSAFFLHITDGNPTAGCVAINKSKLVKLLRWLKPATHPRILIGVR